MNTDKAFAQFKEEYPDTVIGKSKFAECRPPEVQPSSAMPKNMCNSIYHSNFTLVLDYFYNNLDEIFPLYCEKFIKDTVYDINNRHCSNHVLRKDKLSKIKEPSFMVLLGKQQQWSIREKK